MVLRVDSPGAHPVHPAWQPMSSACASHLAAGAPCMAAHWLCLCSPPVPGAPCMASHELCLCFPPGNRPCNADSLLPGG